MTSISSSDLHRPQWPWQTYKDHIFTWMNCSWTIFPNRISINVRHTSLFILLPFPWLNISIVDIKEKKTSVLQHADSVKLHRSINHRTKTVSAVITLLTVACFVPLPILVIYFGSSSGQGLSCSCVCAQPGRTVPCSQMALERYVINMIHMWIIPITLTKSGRR